MIDLIDTNPANAGFAWPLVQLSTLLRQDGIQRQDPDPHGLAVTRQAISDYYNARGVRVPPDRLYLSASTSEAYSWIFKLLCTTDFNLLATD